VTTVRIAHAEPRPGRMPDGSVRASQFLVVLADDAARRALPLWVEAPGGRSLWQLLAGSGKRARWPGCWRRRRPGCWRRPG
jgi:hypothetical protein